MRPALSKPDFSLETMIESQGSCLIAGVDEVGRGPLAGPVVAAAVIIPPSIRQSSFAKELDDSKKMSAKKRSALAQAIEQHCICSVSFIDEKTIDQINILQASLLAMKQCIEQLDEKPRHILIDGIHIPSDMPIASTAVIKGDSLSASIAAASILAKVKRDHYMIELHQEFPFYGWNTNAGYGTKIHMAGLQNYGVTPYHRRSFTPVDKILKASKY